MWEILERIYFMSAQFKHTKITLFLLKIGVWCIHKKNSRFVNFSVLPTGIILHNYFTLLSSLTFTTHFHSKNYNKVCGAATLFSTIWSLLLCRLCTLKAPQSIYSSSFVLKHCLQRCIWTSLYRESRRRWRSWQKSLHVENLIFPIKVGVHYRDLFESKPYRVLLQPHRCFQGASLFPQLDINNLIIKNVCCTTEGGRCLILKQSCG